MRSSLSRSPRAPTSPEEIDNLRRLAWHQQGVVAIRIDDERLNWTERELVKGIAVRWYGKRQGDQA